MDDLKEFIKQEYALLLIILGPCLLFGPMLLKGEALFWGTPLLQFVPWRQFAFDALTQGFLPHWNPGLGMGAPLIANYQSAIFYPPNWLLFFVDIAWGQSLLVLLHVVWAGLGMVYLIRRFQLNRSAQVLGGLAFSLSGYLIARAGFLSINNAVAWLPWVIAGIERLSGEIAEGGNWRIKLRSILLLSFILAMQWLAGHAQIAWYSLLFAAAWASWKGNRRNGWKGIIRALCELALSSSLAFLLASIQLIPTLEYLLLSQRGAAVDPELALTYSFWPWRILGLLLPNLFGNPASGDYWGYANFWEDAIYVGILPLLLVFAIMIREFKSPSQNAGRIWFLTLISLISLILGLGDNTPIFPFLYEHVPTFNLFQAPARWMILFVFSFSLMAAFGADQWRENQFLSTRALRLGTTSAITTMLAAWLGGMILPAIKGSMISAFIAGGFWLSLAGILALTRESFQGKWWGPGLIGAVVLMDLVFAGRGLNPSQPIALFSGKSALGEEVDHTHRIYMESDVENWLKFEETHTFQAFKTDIDWRIVRDWGLPNTTLLDKIDSVNNFDPILPSRYVVWMERLDKYPSDLLLDFLAFMDVETYLAADSSDGNGIRLRKVASPARVRLVEEPIWVEDPEVGFDLLASGQFDFDRMVVLEGEKPAKQLPASPEGTLLLVDQPNPNHVRIETESSGGGWLVLSDLWYPGWKAEVDSEPTEIYRANYLFRSVYVPPGAHSIDFSYRPKTFTVGWILSISAWIVLGWLWWRINRN